MYDELHLNESDLNQFHLNNRRGLSVWFVQMMILTNQVYGGGGFY